MGYALCHPSGLEDGEGKRMVVVHQTSSTFHVLVFLQLKHEDVLLLLRSVEHGLEVYFAEVALLGSLVQDVRQLQTSVSCLCHLCRDNVHGATYAMREGSLQGNGGDGEDGGEENYVAC